MSRSHLSIVLCFSACLLLGYLYNQAIKTEASIEVSTSTVIVKPELAPIIERPAKRLDSLKSLEELPNKSLVIVEGLVVGILDKKGMPYILTIADDLGTAEVVLFTAPAWLKDSVRFKKWIEVTAEISFYKGQRQLRPVSATQIVTSETIPHGADLPLELDIAIWPEGYPEGAVVYFQAQRVLTIKTSKSGKSISGYFDFLGENKGRIDYYWYPIPDGIEEGSSASGYAKIGLYRGVKQLQPLSSLLKMTK